MLQPQAPFMANLSCTMYCVTPPRTICPSLPREVGEGGFLRAIRDARFKTLGAPRCPSFTCPQVPLEAESRQFLTACQRGKAVHLYRHHCWSRLEVSRDDDDRSRIGRK